MDVSAIPATPIAMATASKQLQTVMEAQVAMLREMAELQQQTAQMLTEGGLGQTIDVRA